MNRTPVASFRKILPLTTLALLLFCAPLLAAPEKEPRSTNQVSAIETLASLWGDLTAWVASGLLPKAGPPPQESLDSGCAIDPHGGCGG